MMTVAIAVNEEPIESLTIINIGETHEPGRYWYDVYRNGEFITAVTHIRKDSALALVQSALQAIRDRE